MADPVLFAVFLETFTTAFFAMEGLFATGLTAFFATAFFATTFFATALFVTAFLAEVFFLLVPPLLGARLAGACFAGRFAAVRVLFTARLAAFLAVFFAAFFTVFFAEADFWARAVAIFSSWAERVGTPLRARSGDTTPLIQAG